jgi:hypothetical protein
MPTASILFCDRCGSEKVDVASVRGGRQRKYRIRCYACNGESAMKGFTIGRAEVPEQTFKEARGGRAGQQTARLPQVRL